MHENAQETPTPEAEPPLKYTLKKRLEADGRWPQVEPLRDQMMREARKARGLTKEEAQDWVYAELDKLYPPLPPVVIVSHEGPETAQGLGGIPADWPELPDNAPLAAELGWVQAQRLRIVEERPGGQAIVRLDRAGSPPPSWAALGWLETSIRSYAKFVDICAKGLGQQELESDLVRRERRSIEEVRRLLAEMLE